MANPSMPRRGWWRAAPIVAVLAGLLGVLPGGPALAQASCPVPAPMPGQRDRDALWRIVHCRCTPAALDGLAPPWPCTAMNTDAALLKDLVGETQYLLIPTARITGIEDPALLAPGVPNYMALAWRGRALVGLPLRRGLARDMVGLAVNAAVARTQDQLHIHLDCLRPEVRSALAGAAIGAAWAPLGPALPGWQARRLAGDGDDLGTDPFALMAAELPGAAAGMGHWTLLVTAVADPPGFVALAGRQAETGNAEHLQDHGCAVGR
jgi:CDP-diacylglycerol pyrophosphatase